MSRALPSGLITKYKSSSLSLHYLLKLEYDSGDSLFWSGVTDIVYAGDTYVGTGSLGSIGNISENVILAPAELEVALSGIPSSIISIALGEEYQGRTATVFMSTGELLSAGVLDPNFVNTVFKGLMDVMSIQEDGDSSSIILKLENELIRLTRSNERRMTDQDQRIDFPNDAGFSRVQLIQDQKLEWKGKDE